LLENILKLNSLNSLFLDEDIIITTTTIIATSSPYTTVASTSDRFAVFKRFIKEENFTEAQQFCHGNLNGELMEIVRLDLTRNETLSLLTGWVGLRLSNSTFRWFNNETASEIMQCFPGPNPNQSHCVFFECMNSSSGVLPLDCIEIYCQCQHVTAVFFACVKGNQCYIFLNYGRLSSVYFTNVVPAFVGILKAVIFSKELGFFRRYRLISQFSI
jgi:hypothetical protein